METDIVLQPNDKDGMGKMLASMGPGMVDQLVRQAIQFCWMQMPAERQNPEAVGAEVRRILDRALRNLAEDVAAMRSGPPFAPTAE
jgi:hypothetical protein